jgi:uncharacterized repeat protein (TIGR01451 family)
MTTTNVYRLKSLLITLLFFFVQGFSYAQSYVSEANSNGFFLKKVVSDTTIASGQTFSYTIYFSIPAGASNVNVSDVIPTGLSYQSHSVSAVCGTMNTVSTPVVNGNGGTLQLAFPSVTAGCSGSISITVKFPEGITCNGTTVRNRACMFGTLNGSLTEFCTGFVITKATAINPWQISKYVTGAAYQGGSCPNVTLDSVVTYQICVSKMYGTNGQLNLVGGVVKDVLPAGAVLQSSTCGVTQSGNVLTWNVGNVSVSPPYNNQCCNISVLYPRALFPLGSQITNNATLSGNLGSAQTCGSFNQTSNTTCVEIKGYTQGSFGKYAYTTGQPGCGGYYSIWFCNTGTLPISGLTITDNLPTTLTGYTTSNGAGVTSSISGGVMTATYAGTLAPGACAYVQVNFTIPASATVGSTINNCATVTYTGLATPIQSCAPFVVAAPAAQACIWKDVCGKLPSYTAGQTFRYRLRVQNIGGQAITGASITDILNPNLTYVGNPTYYTTSTWNSPCSSGSTLPSGATALTGVSFSQSGQTLTFGLPTIPASCQSLFYIYCSNYGNFSVPYYYIEFDVKVSDSACIGNIPNYFAITGGNVTAQNSNVEYVNVVGTAAFNLDKTVSNDNGATYASSTTAAAGNNVRFKVKFTPAPSSTTAMRHATVVDLMPRNNGTADLFILNRLGNRGSAFDLNYQSTISTTPTATGYYDASNVLNSYVNTINIPSVGIMFPYAGGSGTPAWTIAPIPANSKNIYAYFGSTAIPLTGAEGIFDAKIPTGTAAQLTACNTFAGNAATCHLINSSLMTNQAMAPQESGTACVTTTSQIPICCDSVKVAPSSSTTSKCCSRITFTGQCEIKGISVSMTNGTISSASFAGASATCYNNPSPSIGTAFYNFTPVSGVCTTLDLQLCAKATTSGWVYINYTVLFANGSKCDKRDSIQCEIPLCCEAVQVIKQDTLGYCCSQIKANCPIKNIQVSITGGTLGDVSFAGANAGCFTQLIGSTLTTANFAPSCASNTGVNLIICPILKTGPMVITYVITFADGTTCTKEDVLDCKPKPCCETIQVIRNDVQGKCCSQIKSFCPIKNVQVTVSNGVIGDVSFAGAFASCYTPLSGSGLTTANFPASCSNTGVDLTICPKPSANPTIITYVITFADGMECKKTDTLNCIDKTCCEKVEVIKLSAQGKCCSEIKASCPIKGVTVSVSNGTLGDISFLGTTASCYIPLTGSALTSLTVTPSCVSNTGIDLVICPKPTANPMIITYLVTFADGTTCTKSDTLNCLPVDPVDCCEATKVVVVPNQKCCSQLVSKCYVDKVVINVTGGVIGNVSFAGASASCYTGLTGSTLTNTTITASCATTSGFDMTICPKTTTATGVIIINYTVIFADGKKCAKTDTLYCTPYIVECCKETEVISYDTQGKCCSQIKTTCKIKTMQVSVVNGAIGNMSFGGVDAACYTAITGSSATSILIAPTCAGGAILDMTICPTPTATPTIIKYTIVFANSNTECVKYDTLYCKPDTACTIAACFAHNATGLNVNFNATGTTSNYPIVMYVWSYGDGTYGTSTTPTISHNYTTSGTYEVCMTVQVLYKGTICDCSKKICKKIQIAQGATSSSACTSSLTNTGATGEVGQLKASPNPSSHDFHVTLDKMESVLENGKAEIKLYNVQGKLILTKTIDVLTKEFDIQAESYPAGLYMLTLQKDGEVISSIKVVKN